MSDVSARSPDVTWHAGELTREGFVYIVVLVIIGFALLNTANNLLWIVEAAMLAAIVVSGIGSANL